MTLLAAVTREDIAEMILNSRQISAVDIRAETGLSVESLRRHTCALEREGRIHRVRPLGLGVPTGGIWAPGREPRDDDAGEARIEPVQLVVKHWEPEPTRCSTLELFIRAMITGGGVHA